MATKLFNELVFKHMVEFTNSDCVFCSTQEKETGKVRLYLVFDNDRQIYSRNGLKGTWVKVQDQDEHETVRDAYTSARRQTIIPRYSV